jgi:hypothetical protein
MKALTQFSVGLIAASLLGLAGCSPAGGIPAGKQTESLSLSPSRMATSTAAPSAIKTIPRNSPTISPTLIPTPSQTNTTRPTTIPTPTRGLLPSLTPAPKEECPPPTHEKTDIRFEYDVSSYGTQIVDYFRATGDRAGLDEQLEKVGGNPPNNIAFTEADVTGDQVKETLIIVKQKTTMGLIGTIDMAVFVVGCRDHQYQLLSGENDFYLTGADPEKSGVLDILDINADGIQEIILWDIYYWHSAHADWSFFFDILEWNGNTFHTLFEEVERSHGRKWMEVMNDRLKLQDVDNNGTTDVLIPDWSGFTCGFGPVKITKNIYMWDGAYYRYMWTDQGKPYFTFQAAFAGDYYSTVGLYDKADHSYRRAIEDPGLQPYVFDNYECSDTRPWNPPSPDYVLGYARFRLVELLAFLGKDVESEYQLTQLEVNFPNSALGHQYATLAGVFWSAFSPKKDIDGACAAVREEAARRPNEIFDPLYFGYQDPGPTLDTICPFHSGSG